MASTPGSRSPSPTRSSVPSSPQLFGVAGSDVSFDLASPQQPKEDQLSEPPPPRKGLLRTFLRRCPRLWSVTSLSIGLLVSLTMTTALPFSLVGYLFPRAGLRALGKKAQSLRLVQVQEHFDHMLSLSPVTLNMLEIAFLWENGLNGTEIWNVTKDGEWVNAEIQRNIFYRAMNSMRIEECGVDHYALKFGTETGEFYGLTVSPHGYCEVLAANGSCYLRDLDMDGSVRSPVVFLIPFDPRVRQWYLAGKAIPSGNTSWSTIYHDLSAEPQLTMDLVRPFYDPNEPSRLIGVFSNHIHLSAMNDYLHSVANDGEVVYAIDDDGMLVATSVGVVGQRDSDDLPWEKILATEHSSSVVRETAIRLTEFFHDENASSPWRSTESSVEITDHVTSMKYLVDVLEYWDSYGFDVFIVIATPRRNVFGEVDKSRSISIGLSGGFLVFSLVLAVLFAGILSEPLRQLSRAMRQISQLNFRGSARTPCSNLLRLHEFSKLNREMSKMSKGLSSFAQFVPRDVVMALVDSGQTLSLQMRREDISVFFVDIQEFTSTSESVSPERLLKFLCEFFELSTWAISEFDGTLDKLIGDCVMAFWNAPKPVEDHALKAVEAATLIIHETEERNERIGSETLADRIPITFRCGINTGEALVGLIGSEKKVSYTVLGDVVNIASRLEPLNKNYDSKILVGPKTASLIRHEFVCQHVDTVMLKGKSQSLPIYSVDGRISADGNQDCPRFISIKDIPDEKNGVEGRRV